MYTKKCEICAVLGKATCEYRQNYSPRLPSNNEHSFNEQKNSTFLNQTNTSNLLQMHEKLSSTQYHQHQHQQPHNNHTTLNQSSIRVDQQPYSFRPAFQSQSFMTPGAPVYPNRQFNIGLNANMNQNGKSHQIKYMLSQNMDVMYPIYPLYQIVYQLRPKNNSSPNQTIQNLPSMKPLTANPQPFLIFI